MTTKKTRVTTDMSIKTTKMTKSTKSTTAGVTMTHRFIVQKG